MFNNHNSGINFKIAKITVVILIALLTIACGNREPWQSEILITDDRETITLHTEILPPNAVSCELFFSKQNLDSRIRETVHVWERFGDDCDTSYCETISLERGFRYRIIFNQEYGPPTPTMPIGGNLWAQWYIDVPALQDDNGLIEEAIQSCEESLACVVDPETSPCDIQAL